MVYYHYRLTVNKNIIIIRLYIKNINKIKKFITNYLSNL